MTLGQHTKSCPEGEIVVDPQRGSGTIQSPITNATVLSCSARDADWVQASVALTPGRSAKRALASKVRTVRAVCAA